MQWQKKYQSSQDAALVNIKYIKDKRYIGIRHLLRNGSIFNFDFLFGEPTKEWMPYDINTFQSSKQKYLIGATNCQTGQIHYFERNKYDELVEVLQASSSLPLLSKPVYINGIPYLDGGISNAVPFQKPIEDNIKRIVVISTRPNGYQRKTKNSLNILYRMYYRKYLELVRQLCSMDERYNKAYKEMELLKKEDRLFVFQPEKYSDIKMLKRDPEKLKRLYLEGRQIGQQRRT